MPGRDGTGPLGLGPINGGAFGYGCRMGIGRGLVRNFAAYQTSKRSQKGLLQEQKDLLQRRMEAIDQELKNL